MKKFFVLLLFLSFLPGTLPLSAQTSQELSKAQKSGKTVFLVAYTTKGVELDKAVAIAKSANQKAPSATTVVTMNASDAGNKDLVTKFRISGAPLPLILVLDKNGTAAGGVILKEATAEKLVDMIPSQKTSELLKGLADGKSVYIVVYKESMASKKEIMNNCATACTKMKNTSITIQVNADDKKETKLLRTLKYDNTATQPVTYVVNSSGQLTDTYNGMTNVNSLIGSAQKVIKSSCCPGGSKTGVCK